MYVILSLLHVLLPFDCRVEGIVNFHEASVNSNLPQRSPIAVLFQNMMRSLDEQVSVAYSTYLGQHLSGYMCGVYGSAVSCSIGCIWGGFYSRSL